MKNNAKKRPAILLLIRPQNHEDPSLIRANGRYLLPRILEALQKLLLLQEIIVSLPDDIPGSVAKELESWALPLDYCPESCPASRIHHNFKKHGLHSAVILNAYSYMLDFQVLQQAISAMLSKQADFIFTENVCPAKYFCIVDMKGIEHFLAQSNVTATPLKLHIPILANPGNLRVVPIHGTESSGENFLWKTIYGDSRNQIPTEIIKQYYSAVPEDKWFSPGNFNGFWESCRNTGNWQWIDRFFKNKPLFQEYSFLLGDQIAWVNRFLGHIPQGRNTFLEIGFGLFPAISCHLLNFFCAGFAFDPAARPDVWDDTIDFLCKLQQKIPSMSPLNLQQDHQLNPDAVKSRLTLKKGTIDALEIPPGSIDFIVSKNVLNRVKDVAGLLAKIDGLIAPKGIMLHQIPFCPYSEAGVIDFSFLAYSKEEWLRSDNGGNLWRLHDFQEFFISKGGTVEILHRNNPPHVVKPTSLHNSWSSCNEEDLYCSMAVLKVTFP